MVLPRRREPVDGGPVTIAGATLTPGSLFPTKVYGGTANFGFGRQYDVTRDGRFLINSVLDEVVVPITLIRHWQPDAKR